MGDLSPQQEEVMDWYEKMLTCVDQLPPDERAAFDHWDQNRADGVATSDWPGFQKYIGKRPFASSDEALRQVPCPQNVLLHVGDEEWIVTLAEAYTQVLTDRGRNLYLPMLHGRIDTSDAPHFRGKQGLIQLNSDSYKVRFHGNGYFFSVIDRM